MRKQLRSICPACFAMQALRNGQMVQHGYTRPDGYYANVGTCPGTGKAHFGTEAGRDEAAKIAAGLRRNATNVEASASAVRASDPQVTVFTSKREGGRWTPVAVDAPTAAQREAYATTLDREANACRAAAVEFDAKVASWSPMDPIEVAVEKKESPVHFRATFYSKHGHKACASSAMGAMRGYAALTSNKAEVTCERCKARRAFIEAK